MPSFCGLPCCGTSDKRHPSEPEQADKIVEKPVLVAVPVHNSTTASYPARKTSTFKPHSVNDEPPVSPLNEKDNTTSSHPEKPITPINDPTPAKDIPLPPDSQSEQLVDSNESMDQLKGATSGVTDTVSSGAQQASSGVQSAASTATNTASTGAEKAQGTTQDTKQWDAMTEDQKKATFDALPAEKKENLTYYEWIAQGYQNKKENWMPWIEDLYLSWFTKDNKASYAAKDTLDKSKVTGIEQVDTLQDGVNSLAAGQVGQGGLLQPVGDAVSKEGVNRAERGGKDEGGSYLGSAGSSVWGGAKSAGGYVGGMFGGKKEGS